MIAVVSHDAGGAEVLSSHIRRQGLDCAYVLDGPARRIFERKLGPVAVASLQDGVSRADWILCGTSWESDLETDAIRLARLAGKRCVAFLDHWVNYSERFTRFGNTLLPDEIWVGDDIALSMARRAFPGTPISLVPNPYLLDIEEELRSETNRPSAAIGQAQRILFVTEPIGVHAALRFGNERHWGYVEEEALRYFLDNVSALASRLECVVIRPHPSEPADKYDQILAEYALPISRGGQRSLTAEVADCDIVVGCNSMAMVVGLVASRRVVTAIPPGGAGCLLPQAEIQSLQDLVRRRDN